MAFQSPEEKVFLTELCTQAESDPTVQVSMYEVGQALGMEKDQIDMTAQSLFLQEYAELKTLAGGIGITDQGLRVLDVKPAPGYQPDQPPAALGPGPVLNDSDKTVLESVVQEIREALPKADLPYSNFENIVIDLKTLDVQMLSGRPKTAIVREILWSVLEGFTTVPEDLKAKLTSMCTTDI